MTMVQAMAARGTGGPEVLGLVDVPSTAMGPTEVRVAVRFSGVNFWDVMQRRGVVPLGPGSVPGVEGVGEVIEVGPEVDSLRVGDRVAWSKVAGSYAQQVVGAAWMFVPVPAELADEDAARVLMQGVTAQYLAESTWTLETGDSAVVMAAAGGVGTLLTQFLGARGVRVVGVVSRDDKKAAALEAGAADVVVDSERFVDDLRSIVPDGAGAVFDANGGESALRGLELLRTRGALVLYGAAGGPVPPLDLGRLGDGSLYVTRAAGRDYARTPEEWRSRADDVLARAGEGALRAVAGGVWPLSEAAEAHRHLESRASVGKLLLAVS
ncbi:zinc-binding dehydrogenase [Aeromicrobium sp. YIM 150415]|nr:zinc-binding dehydrogenase [Aeromicrobium sp. YIM 150415]